MAAARRIEITCADVEPVRSFIARVIAANALISAMTALEAAALPGTVAAGIAELQSALRDLGARPAAADPDGDDGP